MDVEKTYTERAFDRIFRGKDLINYGDVQGKLGRRDQKVVQSLVESGIEGKYCLDVGPGTGRWLQFLKDKGAAYLAAIDISDESLSRCCTLCDKVQKCDVEKDSFDFSTSFFDVVISFMTLEHLRDPEKYLSEIYRVAKPTAIILMTIPNLASLQSRIRLLFGILPSAITCDDTHVKFYTQRELRKLFSPFHMEPKMIPTSFSLDPFHSKSLRVPTFQFTKTLDDHLLFMLEVRK